jgi:hypothetical protein
VYAVTLDAGRAVKITVTVPPPDGTYPRANLDIKLQLLAPDGTVQATADPQDTLGAALSYITTAGSGGVHHIRVSGTGKGDLLGVG